MDPASTSSLPNFPLCPRGSRSGSSRAIDESSSATAPAGTGFAPGGSVASSARRPKPSGRRSATGGVPIACAEPVGARLQPDGRLVLLAQALHTREDPALAVVEPRLDVGREQEGAARGPHPERDRDRVLRLVR